MELVQVENGQIYATSLMVATAFGKQHRNVIQNIEILIANMKALDNEEGLFEDDGGVLKIQHTQRKQEIPMFFIESSYTNHQNNQQYKMYKMTKNGFALLVMGFTGLKSLEWKLRYIEAYDSMEKEINQVGNICISNTVELERIKRSAKSIVHIEKELRKDMKEMEQIIRRIGDRNAHLYTYGTQILDMSKNIEQGKLRDINEY